MNASTGRHAEILNHLGGLLTRGELAAGQVLRTDELGSRFKVSRTVVREAIRVLESMGMVSSRRRVGVTVAPRSQWNVYDPRIIRWRLDGTERAAHLRSLSELRTGIEPTAAALAAQHADPEQCGALTGAAMEMAVHGRSRDLQAYLDADVRFHRTLLAASGNEMLAALDRVVEELLAGRTRLGLMPTTPEPAAIRLHADVAQAVQAGDANAAKQAMSVIVEEAEQAMGTSVEEAEQVMRAMLEQPAGAVLGGGPAG